MMTRSSGLIDSPRKANGEVGSGATAPLRDCPLCGSQKSSLVFLTIRKCQSCGLRFVNPLTTFRGENETEEYFLSEYLPLHQSNWPNSVAERRAHLAMIQRACELPARPRLLDIGCALGLMLSEARALGWDALGIETSPFAARYAAQHTGCMVHIGNLYDAHIRSDFVDVATLMDVIEHVPDPCLLFKEIRRVLRPNGLLFVVTPNFGSVLARLLGPHAYGIGPEEHVVYFQRSTLRLSLQRAGFGRIRIGSKDFYAENLRRLLGARSAAAPTAIKTAFGARTALGGVRLAINKLLAHLPIGDKLIALAWK